jgi:short-subunit dehydrogenase
MDSMRYPPVEPKNVLVTGCSTGIGAATAVALRERGWRVIPTARKEADLDALRRDGFEPVSLDMAESGSIAKAVEQVLALTDQAPGAVVNNAGYGQPGPIEAISRDAMRRQFEVNVFGMQELTNALIPHFRRNGGGRIVNISSVLGRVSFPFNAVYSASKFAMEALSDALRIELDGSGIAVSLVEPGPIASAFRKNAVKIAHETLDFESSRWGTVFRAEVERRLGNPQPFNRFTLPPESVASKIAHALESPRPRIRYCVTIPAYAGAWARRLFPDAMTDAVIRRSARKKLRRAGN